MTLETLDSYRFLLPDFYGERGREKRDESDGGRSVGECAVVGASHTILF